MPILSTRLHGVLDYAMGALLIVAPWLFGFAQGGAETWVPVILGTSVVLYSLLTDYELGVWGQFSMSAHLWLDGIGGVLLGCSPWLFAFADHVWIPHLALGILELAAAMTTSAIPSHGAAAGAPIQVSQFAADRVRPPRASADGKDAHPARAR